jgi:hypothetical protein
MAQILAVHGIAQQYGGDAVMHSKWWPALLSGLHLAGRDLSDPKQLECAFYGHLFRNPGTLSAGAALNASDVGPEEQQLLDLMWRAAAEMEPQKVPSPESYGETLARTPQFVQRALSALSRSKFFINLTQSALIGNLKQVFLYLNDKTVHQAVLDTVTNKITPDTRVVIGHSLGSVVAYEALCQKPESVIAFLSIGSPLGIQNLIFHKLTPPPSPQGMGAWPGKVKHWTNIADAGDIVALEKKLASFFGTAVKDVLVYNGFDAHNGESYLTTREAGMAIAAGLP